MENNDLLSPTGETIGMDQKTPALSGEKKFPVVEMFGPTIEGEGAVIGEQTMFIRFGLCDYKCKKCDSMHAVDPKIVRILGAWRTASEIFADMVKLQEAQHAQHIKTVTFSGGNPAIHELGELVTLFRRADYKINVETQGTKSPAWLCEVDHVVVSPKSPGMGETFNFQAFQEFVEEVILESNARTTYSVKVVAFTAQDLEFAAGVAGILDGIWRRHNVEAWREIAHWQNCFYISLGNPLPPVFQIGVDPTDGKPSIMQDTRDTAALVSDLLSQYKRLAEDILKDPRLSFARFLPQLHVLVYGNETGK